MPPGQSIDYTFEQPQDAHKIRFELLNRKWRRTVDFDEVDEANFHNGAVTLTTDIYYRVALDGFRRVLTVSLAKLTDPARKADKGELVTQWDIQLARLSVSLIDNTPRELLLATLDATHLTSATP